MNEPESEKKIKTYPRGGTYVDFDGEPDADVEKWLGDNFVLWVPATRELVVLCGRPARECIAIPTDRLARRGKDHGLLYIFRSAGS